MFLVGGCKPADLSHWFMREAVSAWRARRKSSSRARLPWGCFPATSLDFFASSANRSSKLASCLTRFRCFPVDATPHHYSCPEYILGPAFAFVCPAPDGLNGASRPCRPRFRIHRACAAPRHVPEHCREGRAPPQHHSRSREGPPTAGQDAPRRPSLNPDIGGTAPSPRSYLADLALAGAAGPGTSRIRSPRRFLP
jgi:hypothetical protein